MTEDVPSLSPGRGTLTNKWVPKPVQTQSFTINQYFSTWTHKRWIHADDRGKGVTEWMVGPLGKVASPFRPNPSKDERGLHDHDVGRDVDLELGAWPDCWVFVEFLRAPTTRKGSDSTTRVTHSLALHSNPTSKVFRSQLRANAPIWCSCPDLSARNHSICYSKNSFKQDATYTMKKIIFYT